MWNLNKIRHTHTFCYKFLIKSFSWKKVHIPMDKIEISFSRSGGAGGQNVNKLNTKVEYRFKLAKAEWLSEEVKTRMVDLFPNKITNDGELIVTSQEHRTQEDNRKEAEKKLQMMIFEASLPKRERIMEPIVETEQKRDQRLKEKKMRSKIKSMRKGREDF